MQSACSSGRIGSIPDVFDGWSPRARIRRSGLERLVGQLQGVELDKNRLESHRGHPPVQIDRAEKVPTRPAHIIPCVSVPYRDLVNSLILIAILLCGCSGVPSDVPRTMHGLQDALREPSNAAGLVLSQCKLKEVPPEIARLKGLKGLDLSGNELASLPAFLSELPELELLDLRSNHLKAIPPWVVSMPKLRKLYLSDNQIGSVQRLPPGLEELYLSQNQLQALPSLPSHLRLLHLADNRLESLDELSSLTRLEELNVSNNRLQSLPVAFSKLDRLQTLIAKNNRLRELGFDPASNHRLVLVQVEGNPIPRELQERLKKQQPRAEWRFSAEAPEEQGP